MKYLVTGGAGFIGSNFCQDLLPDLKANDHLVIIDKLGVGSNLDNLHGLLEKPNITFFKGDITVEEDVSEVISNTNVIINFAAESHVDRSISDPVGFVKNNVIGTQILLEAARINEVSKFIQVSTDEVYGPIDEGEAFETSILKPSSPYAASKAAADLVAISYFVTYGLDVRITRCANNFGINQHKEKLIPLLINNIQENKKET